MKKNLSLFILILVVLVSGCKKDAPVFPDDAPRSDSYQPITKGTYWTFNGIVSGVTLTQTTTMTGATQTINGKLFYTANTVAGTTTDNSYYCHGGGMYIFRSTTMVYGVTVEFPYLTDIMTVGQKWTAPVNESGVINGVPGQFIGEVIETGITKTVSGKTFSNVVHTKLQLQYKISNKTETWQTFDFYVAKGIGWIQVDTGAFGISSSTTISSYSIK